MQKKKLQSAVLVAPEFGMDSGLGLSDEGSTEFCGIVTFLIIQDGRLLRIMSDLYLPSPEVSAVQAASGAFGRLSKDKHPNHTDGLPAVSWHEMRMPGLAVDAGVSSGEDVQPVLRGASIWADHGVRDKYQTQANSWNL